MAKYNRFAYSALALLCALSSAAKATETPTAEPIQNLRGETICFKKDFLIKNDVKRTSNLTPIKPVTAKGVKPNVTCSVLTSKGYGLSRLQACPEKTEMPEGAKKPVTYVGYEFGDPLIVRDANGKITAAFYKEFTRCDESKDAKGRVTKEFLIHVQDLFHKTMVGFVCKSAVKKFDVCNMSIEDFRAATAGIVRLARDPLPVPTPVGGSSTGGGSTTTTPTKTAN